MLEYKENILDWAQIVEIILQNVPFQQKIYDMHLYDAQSNIYICVLKIPDTLSYHEYQASYSAPS